MTGSRAPDRDAFATLRGHGGALPPASINQPSLSSRRVQLQVGDGSGSDASHQHTPAGSVGPDPRSNGGGRYQAVPGQSTRLRHGSAVAGRSGGVDFFNLSSSILTPSAAAGILNTGFLSGYDTVWKAMDGRSAATSAPKSRRSASWRRSSSTTTGSARSPRRRGRSMSWQTSRLQDPRPAVADIDVAVQVPGCRSGAHQLQRGLFSIADQGGGRVKKTHCRSHDEALRGAEILQHDRPYLGWLLIGKPPHGRSCPKTCGPS